MKGTGDLDERGWTRAWCGCGMPGWGPGSLWVREARTLAKQGWVHVLAGSGRARRGRGPGRGQAPEQCSGCRPQGGGPALSGSTVFPAPSTRPPPSKHRCPCAAHGAPGAGETFWKVSWITAGLGNSLASPETQGGGAGEGSAGAMAPAGPQDPRADQWWDSSSQRDSSFCRSASRDPRTLLSCPGLVHGGTPLWSWWDRYVGPGCPGGPCDGPREGRVGFPGSP